MGVACDGNLTRWEHGAIVAMEGMSYFFSHQTSRWPWSVSSGRQRVEQRNAEKLLFDEGTRQQQ